MTNDISRSMWCNRIIWRCEIVVPGSCSAGTFPILQLWCLYKHKRMRHFSTHCPVGKLRCIKWERKQMVDGWSELSARGKWRWGRTRTGNTCRSNIQRPEQLFGVFCFTPFPEKVLRRKNRKKDCVLAKRNKGSVPTTTHKLLRWDSKLRQT